MHEPDRRHFIAALAGGMVTASSTSLDASPRFAQPGTPVRFRQRLVTGVDEAGRSRVVHDGPLPTSASWQIPQAEGVDFWVTASVPASTDGSVDPLVGWDGSKNQPPRGGIVGRMMTWQPGFVIPRHATRSVDFAIVVSGTLEMGLDFETRVLGPGDVVVQRGTAHSWRVPGPDPCTMVVIMIDAERAASGPALP